jgi:hypothetical protein
MPRRFRGVWPVIAPRPGGPVPTIRGIAVARDRADAGDMDAARHQTAYLLPIRAVVDTVRVQRDGEPVAVLMSAPDGSAFTVTADIAGSTAVRAYSFATAAESSAFLTDTADSFLYLGCDVKRT